MKKAITHSEVKHIVKKYHIQMPSKFTIIDGLVCVQGDVRISHKGLTRLPLYFGRVDGDFIINGLKLKSLKGCPVYIGGNFSCKNNELKSLKNGPDYVRGNYDCSENELTTLIGCATSIGCDLLCNLNGLVRLEGSPERITGLFNCKMNKLTSLEGHPKEIYGRFNVSHNRLVSFSTLTDFKFTGEMYSTSNYLSNLKGLPKSFEGLLLIDRSTKSLNTGNVIHKYLRLEIRLFDNFGFHFLPSLITKNHEHIDLIFKYQYYYDIWDENDELVDKELLGLVQDIEDGLL